MLAGQDLSSIVGGADIDRSNDGILLHWTSLAFIDHTSGVKFKPVFESSGIERSWNAMQAVQKVDWQKRGQMRGMFDGRWKFARYFSPNDHHMPQSWDELNARNDFELYDTVADPGETQNLAGDLAFRQAVLTANAKTNELIQREIGEDAGAFLPGFAK